MDTISAKVPSSWKKLLQDIAEKNKIEFSDLLRQVIKMGLDSQELSGELKKLKAEGDLVSSSKRTLEVRRAMAHFGGHESGWRATGAKLEDADCRFTYSDMNEEMQAKAKDYAKQYMESKKPSENQVTTYPDSNTNSASRKAFETFAEMDKKKQNERTESQPQLGRKPKKSQKLERMKACHLTEKQYDAIEEQAKDWGKTWFEMYSYIYGLSE